jgi:endoglucanase
MRMGRYAVGVFSLLLLAGGCGGTSTSSTTTTSTPPATSGISISGNLLFKNGVQWTPKGLQLSAFVASPAVGSGVYAAAYQHFTLAELNAIQAWGADTVRFQIGQPEMDSQSPLYTSSFVTQLSQAVAQARAQGLMVILSLIDQSQTGETSVASLPNTATIRAWGTLGGIANNDTGIMFEMFDEASPSATSTNWSLWQSAYQAVINAIRANGAKNVLLAEGLQGGRTYAGAPALSDPLGQTGYAVHPWFFADSLASAQWDTEFGNFAANNVVVATEWSTLTGGGYTEYCDSTTPADAQTLLNYLLGKKIGISGFAFDDPGYGATLNVIGTIVQDLNGTPTTFAGGARSCGQAGFGPGAMLQGEFKTGTVPAP